MSMNIWVKRSLSTAAVAGGLFFAGSLAAQASTETGAAEANDSASLSSPLEIGSVGLGLSSESSSKHSSTVTHTDRRGTATTTKTSESGRKDTVGLKTGKVSVNPSATLKSVTKAVGQKSEHGAKGSVQQHSSGSVKSPISIGGTELTTEHENWSATSKKTTISGKKGSVTSEESKEQASKTSTSVGVGELKVDPQGSFDSHKSVTGWFGEDGAGLVGSDSKTVTEGSSPISFGGLTAHTSQQQAATGHRKQTVTTRRGTWTEEHSDEQISGTEAGLNVGQFVADPKAIVIDRRRSIFATDGEDSVVGLNSSDTSGKLAAPFHFDGVSGFVSQAQASKTSDSKSFENEHGSVTKTVTKESASHQAIAGKSGAISGKPSLAFLDRRNDVFATDGDDTVVASDRKSVVHSAFPYSYDGFALAGDFGQATAKTVTEEVADHSGTTTRTESDEQAERVQPAYVFDGFRGDFERTVDVAELTDLKHLDS
ncbi:hypothetical protein [Kribbella sp. NPDC051770]|uniref:hypothetical protein n=1 Tax=Kribbella sp. NPDC051770 TaxID=3155413 RepID=UPI00341359E1